MKIQKELLTVANGRALTIVTAGNYYVARVRAASFEGRVPKIVVNQNGGTDVTFKVDILESITGPGLTVGEHADAGLTALPADADLEKFRIRTQLTVAVPGAAASDIENPDGFAFSNTDRLKADGTSSVSDRTREIYLLIRPTQSQPNTVWEVCVLTLAEIY